MTAPNSDLKRAFGNPMWTAGDLYREVMLDIAAQSARTLELGSGLTTLDLARAGVKGTALEHEPHWLGYVSGVATAMEVDLSATASFRVDYAPLKDFGPFEWYDYGAPVGIKYDFVVCDGPPQAVTVGARVGLVDVMKQDLGTGCLILYDDYLFNPEPELATITVPEYWAEHHGVEVVEVYTPGPGDGKPFALLKLP